MSNSKHSGDTVWIKVDLHDTLFSNSSVRVEMINPYFKVVGARLLRMDSKSKWAYFPLADTLSEGLYCFRSFLMYNDLGVSGAVRTYVELLNPNVRPQDFREFRSMHRIWMRQSGTARNTRDSLRGRLPVSPAAEDCRPGKEAYQPKVKGRVLRDLVAIPVEGAEVKLFDLDEYFSVYSVFTDPNGEFAFDLPQAGDSARIIVESYNRKGQRSFVFFVELFEPPPVPIDPVMLRWYEGKFNAKPRYRSTVIGDSIRPGAVPGRADHVLYVDENAAGRYVSVLDYLEGRVPGVDVEGVGSDKRAVVRGIGSIYGNPEAYYMVDDVPVSRATINAISLSEVERIEVIKNASGMAAHGFRGANGVIAVYTRKGSHGSFGEFRLVVIGFHETGGPP